VLQQIKHRYSGDVIFEVEVDSLKEAVVAAVKQGSDLQDADLRGADLRGAYLQDADLQGAYLQDADLQDADLRGADLQDADLRGAYLQDADLQGAYLRGAYLRGAYLQDADLRGAYLRGAYLQGAYLRGADLQDADLQDADLRDAYLQGADGVSPHLCTPLLMLLDQPGAIWAYKLVTANMTGNYWPGLNYSLGNNLSVNDADTDINIHCGRGINVATLDWCIKDYKSGYRIMIVEFTANDIAAIPTATDGKFRLHRCKVVGEKDLKEIGLIESSEAQ